MPMTHDREVQPTRATTQVIYLSGVGLILLKVASDLLAYPTALTGEEPQTLIALALLGLALLLYGWIASGRPHLDSASMPIALRLGTILGLLCGAAWILELGIANLNLLDPAHDRPAQVLYFGTTAAGMLLPVLAALLAARQTRQRRAGIVAGLRCGTLGGLLIFLAYTAMATLLLQAGQQEPQTLREFQRSGLANLPTFIVGDYLAAMIAHLWIGLITGLVGGAIGGLFGQIMPRPPKALPRPQR